MSRRKYKEGYETAIKMLIYPAVLTAGLLVRKKKKRRRKRNEKRDKA